MKNQEYAGAVYDISFSDSFTGVLTMCKGGGNFPGSNKDICGFYAHLDVGDLSDGVFSEKRIECVNSLDSDPWLYGKGFFNATAIKKEKREINRIKRLAKKGAKLRVWYSLDAINMCSFMFLMSELKNINCEISAICLQMCPNWKESSYDSWGQVKPRDIENFLPFARKIFDAEKMEYAKEWERLSAESWQLRVYLNGSVIGVPIDFFDSLLLAYVPEGEFRMMEWLGDFLTNIRGGLQFDFLHARACAMLHSDRFERTRDYSSVRKKKYGFNPPIYSMYFKSTVPIVPRKEDGDLGVRDYLIKYYGKIDADGRYIPEERANEVIEYLFNEQPELYCDIYFDPREGKVLTVKDDIDSRRFVAKISVR